MDVSESSLAGIALLADDHLFPSAAFGDLLNAAVADLSSFDPVNHQELLARKALSSISAATVKEAYAALITLLLEAARQDLASPAFAAFLEENKFPSTRSSTLTDAYALVRPTLRTQLARNSYAWPHVTDAQWRLDYYLKDNQVDKVNKLLYLINLQTESSDGAHDKIQFSCTVEQLQDLVSALKDASKAVQTLGQ